MEASQARILFTVTDFLDTDYVALLTEAGLPAKLEEVIVLRGSVPETATDFASFMDRAGEVDTAAVVAGRERRGRRPLQHHVHLGHHGGAEGSHAHPFGHLPGYKSWSDVIGLDRDRYLIINPFFHSFDSTRDPRLLDDRFDDPAAPGLRRPLGDGSHPRRPGVDVARATGDLQTILNHPDLDTFDMSTLRLAVTGAAAIPVEMIVQMRERLGFEKIVTGYGLTETTGIATMCRHTDDPEVIATTSGRAIPDVEVRIVDPDGKETPRGEPGEIVVRGYNVMVGYLDDPEKTAETIDADGWLHTGDIGVMDAAGNIDITDRVKDMFINGGFNAYPAEIESLMLAHPDIGNVAVIGVPDDRLGEVGYAFVVPQSGHRPTPPRSSAGAGRKWPTTSVHAMSRSSIRCRSTPATRC